VKKEKVYLDIINFFESTTALVATIPTHDIMATIMMMSVAEYLLSPFPPFGGGVI
jgi:hypothetical protein